MKFAHALLCALGLSLALPAPLYAQEEATPTTTYTWTTLATNAASFNSPTNGIIYANNQRGFAGSFTLSEGALTDTTVVNVFGDTGKYVSLSINSAGKYVLSVYSGDGTSPTATATAATLTATPGTHRFASSFAGAMAEVTTSG